MRDALNGHYKKMLTSLKDRPDVKELEAAENFLDSRQPLSDTLQSKYESIKLKNKSTFDEYAFGNLEEASKYGRYSEMLAQHMLRIKDHIKKITKDTARKFIENMEGDVRTEEYPALLELAIQALDNDRYTKGGDIIVKLPTGETLSIQIKTLNNGKAGGNAVHASVIGNTCEAWIKALSFKKVETQARKLYNQQKTQVFMQKTQDGIANLTADQIEKLVNTLLKGKGYTINYSKK